MDIPEYAIDGKQMQYYREIVEFDKDLDNKDRKEIENLLDLGYSLGSIIAVKRSFPVKSMKECFVFLNNPDNWVGPSIRLTMFLYQERHKYIRDRFFEYFEKGDFERGYWSVAIEEFLSRQFGFKWTRINGTTYGVYEHTNSVVESLNRYIVKAESVLREEFLVHASSSAEAVEKYQEMIATGYPKLNKTLEHKTTKDVSVVGSFPSTKVRLTDRQ